MALTKITLKSTSRISLNDRFTSLRGISDTTDGIDQRRQVVQTTRKNMRLAQQMEHRPTVIAALGSVQQVRGGVRGRGRGGLRGRGQLQGRGLLQGARGARVGISRGAFSISRGAGGSIRGGSTRGGSTRGGSIRGGSIRGGSIRGGSIRGGSIRGINFQTGAPMTTRGGSARDASDVAVPVKSRLAVQGRLSQPASASLRGRGSWSRGPFKSDQTNYIRGSTTRGVARGRGSFRGRGFVRGVGPLRGRVRGAGVSSLRGNFQTRTFRGRGRGSRGGGYAHQWGSNN